MGKQMTSEFSFLPLKGVGGSLRQALAMMREEKLYSAMYICGTALAIAFTMLIAEVYYIKVADITPEVNRSKTYYLNSFFVGERHAPVPIYSDTFRDLFQTMQTPECVMATTDFQMWESAFMKLPDNVHDHGVRVKLTEPGFFRFYQFTFTEGAPFTQDDFDNRSRTVVVTTEVAELIFGKGAKAVGQRIYVNNRNFTICGVVETPSSLTEKCVADIWCPYNAQGLMDNLHIIGKDGEVVKGEYNINSPLHVAFAVPADKRDAFLKEMKEVEARYNSMHKDEPVDMIARLETHNASVWQVIGAMFQVWDENLYWYVTPAILLLLLVPALNLSGMVASRMEHRLPEMAIRKAFGAKRRTLLWQVIMENLLLTLVGGAIGLCLAWTALYSWRDWVFYIFSMNSSLYESVPIIKGEMFFGPAIFLIALLICTLLNVLAATLPAWLSLRKPIVESMMKKR